VILDISDVTMHLWHVKLSSKGRYAVRALFDIAFYNDGQPTQVKDIAERQAIPQRFLEQIFQDLKRSGIVGSKRGPQGGYLLARPASQIPIGEVVRVIEGAVSLGEGNAVLPASHDPAGDGLRVTEAIFEDVSARIEACLDAVTIADLCEKANVLGIRRPGEGSYRYSI
jgi:Rrf2 family transcriptional regulator, iron-sulfur cluster assembly transcription factor